MANCHHLFLNFNNTIALSSKKKQELRTSRNAVREKIRTYFKEKKNGLSPKFHGQGSFMMNTIIKPIDEEFDIDDGIYFKVEEEPKYAVSTFHQWIFEAVDGHTARKPIDKQTCIRLIYARKYHLDLPIYYLIEGQTPYLAHKRKGWIQSDPREFMKWFNHQCLNGDQLKQLKRIIRYLKAWSDYRKGDLPSGLIFSILATKHFYADERDDVAFLETIKNIKRCLDFQFSCYRPTTPNDENILEEYSQTNKDYFLDRLANLIQSAEQSLDQQTTLEEACKIWQRHFGPDRFISDTSLSEVVQASLDRQDNNDIIRFDETEEFIENRFDINIKYTLKIDCEVSQNGFLTRLLRDMILKNLPLRRNKKLKFYITKCDVPSGYIVKCKVCNVGEEALRRNMIRGQIVDDKGNQEIVESSDFRGQHFVECFIIKNNLCVARAKIDVPISN